MTLFFSLSLRFSCPLSGPVWVLSSNLNTFCLRLMGRSEHWCITAKLEGYHNGRFRWRFVAARVLGSREDKSTEQDYSKSTSILLCHNVSGVWINRTHPGDSSSKTGRLQIWVFLCTFHRWKKNKICKNSFKSLMQDSWTWFLWEQTLIVWKLWQSN